MSPVDVESYVKWLEKKGFVCLHNGEADDLVVVDQQRGLSSTCNWVEYGHVNLDSDVSKRVAGCQAVDGANGPLLIPDGWEYEGSLSQTVSFVPTDKMDKSLTFLRHENGLDVYFNKLTGKEVYLGRTGK